MEDTRHNATHLVYARPLPIGTSFVSRGAHYKVMQQFNLERSEGSVVIEWQPAVCGYRPSKSSGWVWHRAAATTCKHCKQWEKDST